MHKYGIGVQDVRYMMERSKLAFDIFKAGLEGRSQGLWAL